MAAFFAAWGHDPDLALILADIADTSPDRLPGAVLRTNAQGTPIANLRYVVRNNYLVVFKVVLDDRINGLLVAAVIHR
ncbi:MAG: hypothetical protein OXC06_06935 [Acidimicrobiaceae bacterium]|nr:hypothetical protein [Acidimicrobiaceae bacterium]